ncbi:hypothetical protein [Flavivirga sp. 57AJ16]|uniref:hypothetical protein n=1 Tax=Flavivirga sp. 57AJ16 TaxID=3025307 RepID=UPI0023668F80|nr:hypothetical protein [Flavivirga sp. 57AJ16]MDD7887683.1 hypothetical protein [Flavivirga sp. 57AJ16]
MVEVFRTNIDTESKADLIQKKLKKTFPDYKINLDLEDCDNILRLETENEVFDIKPIMMLIKSYGFKIEILPNEIPKQKKSRKKFKLHS